MRVDPSFGDIVSIADQKSPRFGQTGTVSKVDCGAVRYRYQIVFEDTPTITQFLDRIAMQRDLWYSRDQLLFPATSNPVPTKAPSPTMAERPSGVGSNHDELG